MDTKAQVLQKLQNNLNIHAADYAKLKEKFDECDNWTSRLDQMSQVYTAGIFCSAYDLTIHEIGVFGVESVVNRVVRLIEHRIKMGRADEHAQAYIVVLVDITQTLYRD